MEEFDAFWKAFPRKVGKALCRAKFNKITGGGLTIAIEGEKITLKATAAEIVAAAKAYWMQEDGEKQFIPHPATWLNQGRFEDIDEEERDALAERYDRLQERIAAGKLRVIK